MVFTATTIIYCGYVKIIRFYRKSSYIDMFVDDFRERSVFDGDIMKYRIPYKSDFIELRYSVRSKLKEMRGIMYDNFICSELELNYFQNNAYTVEQVVPGIEIITLLFLQSDMGDKICRIINNNLGLNIRSVNTSKINMVAFKSSDYLDDRVDKQIVMCINNVVRDKNMKVYDINKNYVNGAVEYYISLAAVV